MEGHAHVREVGIWFMRMRKKLLFFGSNLLYQRFLEIILNTLLINCKNRSPNKAETKNRTFFVHAHNLDSDLPRMRMSLHGYGIIYDFFRRIFAN